jgi:Tfp pilus assembly PilM family ATPase
VNIFRKIAAFLAGHSAQIKEVAEEIFASLGSDVFTVSPQERVRRIKGAVERYVEKNYPHLSVFIPIIVELVEKAITKKR